MQTVPPTCLAISKPRTQCVQGLEAGVACLLSRDKVRRSNSGGDDDELPELPQKVRGE